MRTEMKMTRLYGQYADVEAVMKALCDVAHEQNGNPKFCTHRTSAIYNAGYTDVTGECVVSDA